MPEWSFPGRGRVQRQLERAKGAIDKGERALQALPLRGKQAAWAATLEDEAGGGRARPRLRRALRRLRRVRGDLRGRPPPRPLGRASTPEDQATFCFDPRVIDWDHYAPNVHLPSVVEHARVRTTPGGRVGREARGPAPAPDPRPRPPLRRLRPREHAHRVERRGVVLLAGHPPPAVRGPHPLRAQDAARGARPAGPRPARPQRLPAPLLPALRRRRRRPARGRRRRRCSATSSS